jgi:hypothetical protein
MCVASCKKLLDTRTGIAPKQAARKRLLYLPRGKRRFKEIEVHVAEERTVPRSLPPRRRCHRNFALAPGPGCPARELLAGSIR